jgi:hypothetical protein
MLLILLHLSWNCNGQISKEQKEHVTHARVDSTGQVGTIMNFVPPDYGVKPNRNPARPSGYVFFDSSGQEINYLTEEKLCAENPYNNAALEKKDRQKCNSYYSFRVKDFPMRRIKDAFSKTLKKSPPDTIIDKTSEITILISGINYNPQNPNYLVITYALKLYNEEGNEEWVESTIHVYDRRGRRVSTIVDNHNVEGTFISPDGRYIIANKIFGMTGDGVSDMYIGIVVYDANKNRLIGDIGNENGIYYTDVKLSNYEKGYFLLRSSLYKDDTYSDDFLSLKLIIDPNNRILYQKIVEDFQDSPLPLYIKSAIHPDGEDITTYDILHF